MFLAFSGVLDIVIVAIAVIMAIVGFKVGFMKKLLSHVGVLVIIAISFFYASAFADMLTTHEVIAPAIYDNIISKLNGIQGIDPNAGVDVILRDGVGLPGFIATMISNGVGNPSAGEAFSQIASYITGLAMTGISFVILLVGLLLILGLLKIIVNALRSSKLIRFFDGLLGIVYHIVVYAIFVMIAFWIVSMVMNQEWFAPAKEWLTIDMKLNTDEFSIAKMLYQNNILKNITDMLLN